MSPELREMLIAGFVPKYVDKEVLGFLTCLSDRTIDRRVKSGRLPTPLPQDGKLMWVWSEVDKRLKKRKDAAPPVNRAEAIRNGTREEARRASQ
jgi:predicted DNA-binding transcriptional regulator AlpA